MAMYSHDEIQREIIARLGVHVRESVRQLELARQWAIEDVVAASSANASPDDAIRRQIDRIDNAHAKAINYKLSDWTTPQIGLRDLPATQSAPSLFPSPLFEYLVECCRRAQPSVADVVAQPSHHINSNGMPQGLFHMRPRTFHQRLEADDLTTSDHPITTTRAVDSWTLPRPFLHIQELDRSSPAMARSGSHALGSRSTSLRDILTTNSNPTGRPYHFSTEPELEQVSLDSARSHRLSGSSGVLDETPSSNDLASPSARSTVDNSDPIPRVSSSDSAEEQALLRLDALDELIEKRRMQKKEPRCARARDAPEKRKLALSEGPSPKRLKNKFGLQPVKENHHSANLTTHGHMAEESIYSGDSTQHGLTSAMPSMLDHSWSNYYDRQSARGNLASDQNEVFEKNDSTQHGSISAMPSMLDHSWSNYYDRQSARGNLASDQNEVSEENDEEDAAPSHESDEQASSDEEDAATNHESDEQASSDEEDAATNHESDEQASSDEEDAATNHESDEQASSDEEDDNLYTYIGHDQQYTEFDIMQNAMKLLNKDPSIAPIWMGPN
ncbi:hypothetical protein KCU92_g8133, partial [Aureobasidium melanogenum]